MLSLLMERSGVIILGSNCVSLGAAVLRKWVEVIPGSICFFFTSVALSVGSAHAVEVERGGEFVVRIFEAVSVCFAWIRFARTRCRLGSRRHRVAVIVHSMVASDARTGRTLAVQSFDDSTRSSVLTWIRMTGIFFSCRWWTSIRQRKREDKEMKRKKKRGGNDQRLLHRSLHRFRLQPKKRWIRLTHDEEKT